MRAALCMAVFYGLPAWIIVWVAREAWRREGRRERSREWHEKMFAEEKERREREEMGFKIAKGDL